MQRSRNLADAVALQRCLLEAANEQHLFEHLLAALEGRWIGGSDRHAVHHTGICDGREWPLAIGCVTGFFGCMVMNGLLNAQYIELRIGRVCAPAVTQPT